MVLLFAIVNPKWDMKLTWDPLMEITDGASWMCPNIGVLWGGVNRKTYGDENQQSCVNIGVKLFFPWKDNIFWPHMPSYSNQCLFFVSKLNTSSNSIQWLNFSCKTGTYLLFQLYSNQDQTSNLFTCAKFGVPIPGGPRSSCADSTNFITSWCESSATILPFRWFRTARCFWSGRTWESGKMIGL